MVARIALRLMIVIGALSYAGAAMGQDKVHDYFNDTALKVQATKSPVQKREILSKNLSTMVRAIDMAKASPMTSAKDDVVFDRISTSLQEKSDELAGVNGFDRVPDNELDAFATYIVQDMEQADQTITISVVALLLIIVIVILIA
jgi:hypothetical protein